MNSQSRVKKAVLDTLRIVAPSLYLQLKLRRNRRRYQLLPELRAISLLCKKDKISIDIGASDGNFLAEMLPHSTQCWAFEANPQSADFLRREFAPYSQRIRIESVALSNRSGSDTFRICADNLGLSTLEKTNTIEQHGAVQSIQVEIKRLDDFEPGPIGLIKVDVEGHEESVLRGAEQTIREYRPSLVVEIEERHKENAVTTVAAYLSSFGYLAFIINGVQLIPLQNFDIKVHQNSQNIAFDGSKKGMYLNNFLFVQPQEIELVKRHFQLT